MASRLAEVGGRLRAYRIGAGLTADDVGRKLHISRASVYRLESEGIGRLDTLERVADLLDVSVETLLGVGVEYVSSALAYFERLRQVELTADRMFVGFGPLAYVLTSDEYDAELQAALRQIETDTRANSRKVPATDLINILSRRKTQYRQRRTPITNVVSSADISRFARYGLLDEDANPARLRAHRRVAFRELKRVAELVAHPPMGVQIGILLETLPSTSFALIQEGSESTVIISPFRLGTQLNVRNGVAMVSRARYAVRLYAEIAQDLWSRAITGDRAAQFISSQCRDD